MFLNAGSECLCVYVCVCLSVCLYISFCSEFPTSPMRTVEDFYLSCFLSCGPADAHSFREIVFKERVYLLSWERFCCLLCSKSCFFYQQ